MKPINAYPAYTVNGIFVTEVTRSYRDDAEAALEGLGYEVLDCTEDADADGGWRFIVAD